MPPAVYLTLAALVTFAIYQLSQRRRAVAPAKPAGSTQLGLILGFNEDNTMQTFAVFPAGDGQWIGSMNAKAQQFKEPDREEAFKTVLGYWLPNVPADAKVSYILDDYEVVVVPNAQGTYDWTIEDKDIKVVQTGTGERGPALLDSLHYLEGLGL
jgi:hypothetical protein